MAGTSTVPPTLPRLPLLLPLLLLLLLRLPSSASSAPCVGDLVNVALDKPVVEVFSGSGDNATASSPDPPVGWFTTAFADVPDHTLFPETLVIDLLSTFNVSAVEFVAPVGNSSPFVPPLNFTVSVGLPGQPAWIPVELLSPTSFVPLLAQLVRVVVTSVDTQGPNFTVSVGRVRVLGLATPFPPPPVVWPPPPRTPSATLPARLQTEGQVSPIDIDTPSPRLSWALASTRQGDTVTAWQVILNRTSPAAGGGGGSAGPGPGGGETLWDSGRVDGTAFACVPSPSSAFAPGDSLVWSVRLWDADGVPTPWADPPATFSMAKVGSTAAAWAGQWIGANASFLVPFVNGPGHPAVYLRGVFNLPALPTRAVASFSGLGWGKLFVNGAPASPLLELSPGYTTYEYRTQYNVIDITSLLARTGMVVLAAILGDGWYALSHDPSCCASFQHQAYVNSTRMLLDVDMWFADGSRLTVGSNTSWQWALGEITSSWFNGESVDKRLALPSNWSSTFGPAEGLGAWGSWRPVLPLDGPPAIFNGSILTSQKEPPTLASPGLFAMQTLRVVPEPGNGTGGGTVHIFDLGREIQGRPVVTASSPASALLRILVCGSFYFTASYTCDETTVPGMQTSDGPGLYNFTLAGTGAQEVYEPLFTYVAVRRVIIHVPAGVSSPTCAVRMLAMDQPASGSVVTSSDTYNWLHSSLARTQVHYTVGFPNDPSRERVGYTQDIENMFRGAAFEFASSERMYLRWMADMADGQAWSYKHPGSGIPQGGGQMPTVIPGPKSDQANSVFWGGMLVWLPWRHFLHYGDDRILRNYYGEMVRYLDWLNASASVPSGLLDWGLADWNSPLPECSGWGFPSSPIINTPGLYLLSHVMASVAGFLGDAANATRFAALASATAGAFNAAFLNASTGAYSVGQQCHQAMALAMDGLVPDEARAAAVSVLTSRIVADNSTLTVGFVSFLHEALVLADEDPALLHEIITRRNYGPQRFGAGCVGKDGPGGRPSTLVGCAPSPYSQSVGAVPSNDLMKEEWQGGGAMMPSLAGPLLLHSYHTLAGIRAPEAFDGAGFRNFSLFPSPVPGISWLNASYSSPLGPIVVNWRVLGDLSSTNASFFLEVIVPPGANALVGVPSAAAAGTVGTGGEAGKTLAHARPVSTGWRGGRALFTVPSGQFFFNSTLPAAPQRGREEAR